MKANISATVGIAGAGLAGLTTAYRLMQQNIPSVIYEASNRTGGRAWTERFPNGQHYEVGGEFIDTNHTDIIDLCAELNLPLVQGRVDAFPEKYMVIDYDQPNTPLVEYSRESVFQDYQTVFPRVSQDANDAWPKTDFDPSVKRAKELDRIDLDSYINDVCSVLRADGDGKKSKFAQLLKVSYNTEYGLEPSKQSCLNMLFLMGFGTIEEFSLYGPSDEKYNIVGGTQALPDKLKEILLNSGLCTINLNSPITKIEKCGLAINLTANGVTTTHPQVVLTIPFPCYESINYRNMWFSDLKFYTIKNSKLGFNSKLNVQFDCKYWNDIGLNGATFATTDPPPSKPLQEAQLQSTWDVGYDQPYSTGLMCDFTAGELAKTFPSTMFISDKTKRNQEIRRVTDTFLIQANVIFPGIVDHFQYQNPSDISNVASMNWSQYPWSRGAYTVYRVGQYAGGKGILLPGGGSYPANEVVPFAGTEGDSEPRSLPKSKRTCHFAGESTTLEWQGWLNGAVFSGNKAAKKVGKVWQK